MSVTTPPRHLPAAHVRRAGIPLSGLAAIALGVIWAAVIVISVFSPDLITGAQHDHIPLAAILTWVWGAIASASVLTTMLAQRGHPGRLRAVALLASGVAATWVAAAVVAVFGPESVTGADPTHAPVSALIAPIAAMIITTTACKIFSSLHPDTTGQVAPTAVGGGSE